MDEQKFQAFMMAVELIGGDYQNGYRLGLRRYYHGERFGTSEEHEKCLNLSGYCQQMGDGYRDGFAGKPPKGMHGNLGNSNAFKENKAGSAINIRVPTDLKAHCVAKAKKQGLTLSVWLQKILQDACKK